MVAIEQGYRAESMHENSVNVLLVEDYYADSYYLSELLGSHEGEVAYRLNMALSLAECKTALQIQKADIICLDLGLPDSDGLETLLAVKQFAGLTPILVVTGFEETNMLSTVRELGFNVLQKGEFDIEMLHNSLQSTLSASARSAT
jgi:CheY-like chemotaxis protein